MGRLESSSFYASDLPVNVTTTGIHADPRGRICADRNQDMMRKIQWEHGRVKKPISIHRLLISLLECNESVSSSQRGSADVMRGTHQWRTIQERRRVARFANIDGVGTRYFCSIVRMATTRQTRICSTCTTTRPRGSESIRE